MKRKIVAMRFWKKKNSHAFCLYFVLHGYPSLLNTGNISVDPGRNSTKRVVEHSKLCSLTVVVLHHYFIVYCIFKYMCLIYLKVLDCCPESSRPCIELSLKVGQGAASTSLKMKTVLMVAEKPSLAQSIAKILSKGACK